jgi:hypothetical protein
MSKTVTAQKLTILKSVDTTIEADFYTTANGRDYYEVVKNSVPTQTFIDVAEGASGAEVAEAFEKGALV